MLVSTTFTSTSEPNIKQFQFFNPVPEPEPDFQHVFYILYLIQVKQYLVEVLIVLSSEVNVMNPDFTKKLGLWIYEIKVGTQKIDGLKLGIIGIIIISFLVEEKEERLCFFEKTFLLVDISIDIALSMPLFTLSNGKIVFIDCHLH